MRSLKALVIAMLFLPACGPTSPSSTTDSSTTITFSGSSPTDNSVYMAKNDILSSGDVIAIDVKANNITGQVYGAAFDVDFDSSRVTYDSKVEGSFLEQGGNSPTYLVSLQSGSTNKLVIGISRQGASSGVPGSGTIVTLKFRVTGNSSLAFSNKELRDSSAQPISGISWSAGSFTIQ